MTISTGSQMPRRQALLGTALAALGAGAVPAVAEAAPVVGAPAAPPLDAELIAACAAFDALEWELRDAFRCGDDAAGDAAAKRIRVAQEPYLAKIVRVAPKTLNGYAALASSYVLWADVDLEGMAYPDGPADERLLAALLIGLTTSGISEG